MQMILAVAGGGAVGALLRYWVSHHLFVWQGSGFPWATFYVNAFGSLALGMVYVLLTERFDLSPEHRGAIAVGLLGALTTFSTFSLETVRLFEAGQPAMALASVFANVIVCIAACAAGLWLARSI